MSGVGTERVSTVVGYMIAKGNFNEVTQNLPQRIVVLAEANADNQLTLDVTPKEITSAQQAGQLYGYGSPIYSIMRILKPLNGGGGIGGIPVIVIPQEEADNADETIIDISPVGTATGNGTHTLIICGRDNLDGVRYDIFIETGDTSAEISQKMEDAVNAVLGCPFSATSTDYEATIATKWKGFTASFATVTVDTGNDALGITYSVNGQQDGAGVPDISDALATFGSTWNTLVINGYGLNDTVMDLLEAFNGIPDATNPTGRYSGIVMKPFIAITGNCDEDQSDITDARKEQVTIAVAPAPLSAGMHYEAAANACVLFARISQDAPQKDVQDSFYPDMPVPADLNIGAMTSYDERDRIVKKGFSTVELVNGKYQLKDFVTTYRPVGETPPQFQYCRNLMIDFNIAFGHNLIITTNVTGKAIANDNDIVKVSDVIKPKMLVQLFRKYADDLGGRGLIADIDFMKSSITVSISTTNPNRLQSFFRYKRSGTVRISDTVAQAGFNFGS